MPSSREIAERVAAALEELRVYSASAIAAVRRRIEEVIDTLLKSRVNRLTDGSLSDVASQIVDDVEMQEVVREAGAMSKAELAQYVNDHQEQVDEHQAVDKHEAEAVDKHEPVAEPVAEADVQSVVTNDDVSIIEMTDAVIEEPTEQVQAEPIVQTPVQTEAEPVVQTVQTESVQEVQTVQTEPVEVLTVQTVQTEQTEAKPLSADASFDFVPDFAQVDDDDFVHVGAGAIYLYPFPLFNTFDWPDDAEPALVMPRLGNADTPFAGELEALAGMGFIDIEKNIELLKQHDGHVDKVVDALLSE